jgi:hypothetical protein
MGEACGRSVRAEERCLAVADLLHDGGRPRHAVSAQLHDVTQLQFACALYDISPGRAIEITAVFAFLAMWPYGLPMPILRPQPAR